MQFHEYDRPVINLHELTNGLSKYYSSDFNREILGKKHTQWGYHQTLAEITELLSGTDHYKTSRLAQYHIRARQDSIEQQVPFYRYLDDNFFVISCRRRNLFEHALSWCINSVTKKLNVYSPQEKIDSFIGLYKDGIEIGPEQLRGRLENYKSYIAWSEDNFSVGSYFYYEDHLPQIEKYILNLPIFAGQSNRVTWEKTFGIDFADWNRCHFYTSDVGALAMDRPQELLQLASSSTLQAQQTDSAGVPMALYNSTVPQAQVNFMNEKRQGYVNAAQSIQDMVRLGILVSIVPIKKQTLAQKMHMIRNIDQCIDVYNDWQVWNPSIAEPVSCDRLHERAQQENTVWRPETVLTAPAVAPLALPPTQQ
jgi:hypothetical protein